jgi:hypothetical protein
MVVWELTEVTELAEDRIMASDNSSCIEQQAVASTHGIMRMFACYETAVVEMKRFGVDRFQCLISASHLQGLTFNIGDYNSDDPHTVQLGVVTVGFIIGCWDYTLDREDSVS